MSLAQSVDQAFKGKIVKTKVDGHGFDIRPPFGPQAKVQRTKSSVKVENYFRHRITGKDNRVHYRLKAETGKPYEAEMVRIEYRGIARNPVVRVGATVTGALKGGDRVTNGILKGIGAAQKFKDGKWEPSAAKLIDALGQRLAKEV
jgi:hypothetical protein